MPYKRKTDRQSWGKEAMVAAIAEVLQSKASVLSTAKKYGIPEPTLRRYVKKSDGRTLEEKDLPQNAGRWKKTFTDDQIVKLKEYVTEIDKRAFGLTRKQFGRLCFEFAERLGINHRFNKEKMTAGKDFITTFMQECSITLRKPEATSLARLSAFNPINVGKFFDTLKELRDKHNFNKADIYNADETGFSTVPTRQPKVLSPQGNRRVIKVTSAERGTTITCVCAMSASGNFVPPFYIFPRIRMKPEFMAGAPPGSEGIAHETGWMTGPGFLKYLEHFVRFTRPSAEHPVLLIMDNHASHTTLEAVEFCRANFVFVIGLPPHCSHKLQPLDVAFYGPLKSAYNVCCNDFMVNNPGQPISLRDVAGISGKAYLQVANARIAIKGFLATGIEPFDSTIFNNEDFAPSLTTDIPLKEVESNNPVTMEPLLGDGASGTNDTTTVNSKSSSCLPQLPTVQGKKNHRSQRKKLPSFHLTSTPVKETLVEKRKQQTDKEEKRIQRQKKKVEISKKKLKINVTKKKPSKRQLTYSSSSESDDSIDVAYIDTDQDMDPEDLDLGEQDNEKDCIICGEQGKTELWFQCFICKQWAHEACSGWDEIQAYHRPYKCDYCTRVTYK